MSYVEIILDLFYLIETHPSVASDCYNVMMMGYSTYGRYTITLHDGQPMDVWCEIKPSIVYKLNGNLDMKGQQK